MSLDEVVITSEAFLTCMTHAFSTESEEIMGLLLGDVVHENGVPISKIWGVMPQIRTDRRKDRVECSSEQVAACTAEAERVSAATGVRTRVVGWYHSHPHITVLPSHIDTRTQAMYQMLDQGFVGLIFSAFNWDAAAESAEVQVTAFQSVRLDPAAAAAALRMDSNDLPGFDAATKAALRAAHQHEMQQRGDTGWERKGVRLRVASMPGAGGHVNPLGGYVVLQQTVAEEEASAYQRALASAGSSGSMGLLARLHHAGVYQQVGARLLAHQCGAALRSLRSSAAQCGLQRDALEEEVAALEALVARREHEHAEQQRLQQEAAARRAAAAPYPATPPAPYPAVPPHTPLPATVAYTDILDAPVDALPEDPIATHQYYDILGTPSQIPASAPPAAPLQRQPSSSTLPDPYPPLATHHHNPPAAQYPASPFSSPHPSPRTNAYPPPAANPPNPQPPQQHYNYTAQPVAGNWQAAPNHAWPQPGPGTTITQTYQLPMPYQPPMGSSPPQPASQPSRNQPPGGPAQ